MKVEARMDRLCGLGQSSWLQIQRPGFDSRRYQIFWEVVGLERGPLSLVSTTEELLERKSSGSGLENREYGRRDPSRWPRGTPYPQKLTLTSPTSGCRSVGIVRSRTQTKEYSIYRGTNEPDEEWQSTRRLPYYPENSRRIIVSAVECVVTMLGGPERSPFEVEVAIGKLRYKLPCGIDPRRGGTLLSKIHKLVVIGMGARCSVVVWATVLQTERPRILFPMRSLYFPMGLIPPAALWPGIDSPSNRNDPQKSFCG
jgi:hypothetical protein